MSANKNEPDKKPAGSASAQAGGRPHATLDLKATDVTPPAAAKDESKPVDPAAQSKAAAEASAAATAAKTSSGAGAAGSTAGKDKPTSTPSSAQRPPARGYGGFFTHVAAGLAGGIVALLAADILADQLGFDSNDNLKTNAALEQRLSALEAGRVQRAVPSDLAARIAAAEAKLGKIEQLDTNIEGMAKKQAELDKGLNALNAKAETQGESETTARVAKLEEQLTLISSAAGNPQSGSVPQLAALTGKLTDLESTMANQLDALRKSVAQEIDTRLAEASEAGQAARSGTQRMDRELSTLKAESAELAAGLTAAKTDSDRAIAALRTTQEDLKRLKAEIDMRLAGFAKAEDVSSAVAPISTKIATIEKDVQGVMKSEGDRRTTAERIVLSLELANLKRAIDRGNAYAPELEQARKVAGNVVDLSALDRFALEGVPTATELRTQFKPVAFKIIDAQEQPAEASIVDRLLAGAKSVVRVRRTNLAADDKSVEAVVGRMEAALTEDRLGDVLTEAKSLPAPAQDAAHDFLAKVEAREAVDRAVASVETQLKASLAAGPAPAADPSAQ